MNEDAALSNQHQVSADQALQEKLRLLEVKFIESLQEKFFQMQAAMEQALASKEARPPLLILHRLLHTLAGSAGTFGFTLLGKKANQLEIALKEILEQSELPSLNLYQFSGQLQEMLFWARNDPKDGDVIVVNERLPYIVDGVNTAIGPSGETSRLIYVVDDDPILGEEIAVQLQFFGYETVVVVELLKLAGLVGQRMPAAIVIDLGFPAGGMAGALEVLRLKQTLALSIPTIFISKDASFEARLAAVRAGASSYFSKPIDLVALTDRLDVLTGHHKKNPYRILIVDDDACSAEYYGALLSNAGMDVRLLHEPYNILREMAEYRPELVLMDVYMPNCSGVELAQLLRQDNLYLDVPIVFLSTERNYGRQLHAIESGGDDFLTKPIRPSHLLSSMTSRVERYRMLRDLIMRDSLTGLYKHSTLKEMLEREIIRAKRNKTPLSFAMIDLDHFKSVNDVFGHPAGDHVIRALSRLLQQRLRRADIVGRYGGEEFAVIFPDTKIQDAFQILETVRQVFGRIRHHTEKGGFCASFSAGIVELGAKDEAKQIIAKADETLYQAKGNGRNQVRKNLSQAGNDA